MADLAITAANVLAASNANVAWGTAGEALSAGKGVYLSSTTKKWMLADSNSATPEARVPSALTLNAAALNQPVAVQKGGDITPGAALTPGVAYYQSDTPGAICPFADVGAGEYFTLIGIAKSATLLSLQFQATGFAN